MFSQRRPMDFLTSPSLGDAWTATISVIGRVALSNAALHRPPRSCDLGALARLILREGRKQDDPPPCRDVGADAVLLPSEVGVRRVLRLVIAETRLHPDPMLQVLPEATQFPVAPCTLAAGSSGTRAAVCVDEATECGLQLLEQPLHRLALWHTVEVHPGADAEKLNAHDAPGAVVVKHPPLVQLSCASGLSVRQVDVDRV